jgi:hypothetical protein
MDTFETLILTKIKEARILNIQEAQKCRPDKENKQKIETKATQLHLNPKYIEREFVFNPDFAASFAKDPWKQNLTEKYLPGYYESKLGVLVTKLPTDEANMVRISDGNIIIGKGNADTKSIDFMWSNGEYTAYLAHKFTRDGGGAQDNQASELDRFMKAASNHINHTNVFYACGDGKYYDSTYKEGQNRKYGKANVFFGSSEEVIDHWLDYIKGNNK